MIEQNLRCYQWSYDLFPLDDQPLITLAEAQAIVQHLWFFYRPGTPAPIVRGTGKDRYATGFRYAITLPQWACVKSLVLHEAAHSLSFDDEGVILDEAYHGHGPLYMRLLIDLYAMFAGRDRQHMHDRAVFFGLLVDRD